jgi:hypothetical protein
MPLGKIQGGAGYAGERLFRRLRSARGRVLSPTSRAESATLQSRLADYLKASPDLAQWPLRWQARATIET